MKNLAVLIVSLFAVGLISSCSKSDVQPTEQTNESVSTYTASPVRAAIDTAAHKVAPAPGGTSTRIDTAVGVITKPIMGKWSLKKDSTVSGFVAPSLAIKVRKGTINDYFDFRADSKLYVKEGPKLDTFGYKQLTDTTVLIRNYGYTVNGVSKPTVLQNLTANSVSVYTPFLMNPGGYYTRYVHLRK